MLLVALRRIQLASCHHDNHKPCLCKSCIAPHSCEDRCNIAVLACRREATCLRPKAGSETSANATQMHHPLSYQRQRRKSLHKGTTTDRPSRARLLASPGRDVWTWDQPRHLYRARVMHCLHGGPSAGGLQALHACSGVPSLLCPACSQVQ